VEGDLLTSAPEAEDRALRAELIGQIDVMPHQGLSAHRRDIYLNTVKKL
jgi:hypothetical protein